MYRLVVSYHRIHIVSDISCTYYTAKLPQNTYSGSSYTHTHIYTTQQSYHRIHIVTSLTHTTQQNYHKIHIVTALTHTTQQSYDGIHDCSDNPYSISLTNAIIFRQLTT